MKLKMLGLLLCLAINYSLAQKPPVKFGDVTLEELKMSRYEKDSSAAAVILYDFGESSIKYTQSDGFGLLFERTTRIKILKTEGTEWADFEIPLYNEGGNDEKVSGLKGTTYNLENGKIVESKVKSDGFFREKVNENWDIVKITLPNVKVGSVLEITYKVYSDFLTNFWDWNFQETIPVAWTEYRATIPEYFFYDKYMQGYVPLDISETKSVPGSITLTSKDHEGGGWGPVKTTFNTDKIDFKEEKFRWAAKDVPAFKSEPFITTYKDYISKINFELSYIKFPNQPIKPYMGSWEDICKKYFEDENFGREITGNGFLKKIVEDVTAGKATPEEKLAAIYHYVKQNVSWDETSRKYTSQGLKAVLDTKKGSSAEINLLLASMLEKANIPVHGVLLSTRDNGFVRESIAIASQFNYTICAAQIDGKTVLLDATDKLLPLGILPARCLNGNGLVIAKEGPSWVKLSTALKTRSFVSAELTVEPEGVLRGKLAFDRSGYSAYKCRKKYFAKAEGDYLKDFTEGHQWELSKSEFKNTKELDAAFKETHEIVINDHVTSSGSMIYLNPFILMQEVENPFKTEKREYPVDFGSPEEWMYIGRFTIPAGYAVDELPKGQIFVLPGNAAKYVYNVVVNGAVINVTSQLQINRSLFTQDEYPNLRQFYAQVVAKQAEQIVLKKN